MLLRNVTFDFCYNLANKASQGDMTNFMPVCVFILGFLLYSLQLLMHYQNALQKFLFFPRPWKNIAPRDVPLSIPLEIHLFIYMSSKIQSISGRWLVAYPVIGWALTTLTYIFCVYVCAYVHV